MHTAHSILVCGHDSALLRTRGLVLESAGHRVEIAMNSIGDIKDLAAIKLAVLCHTLSESDRKVALAFLARWAPHAKALCLVPTKGNIAKGVETLDSFQGPRKLLEVVNQLLASVPLQPANQPA